MRRFGIAVAWTVAAMVAPAPLLANADTGVSPLEAVFLDVARARTKVQSLHATFTQDRVISLLASTVQSKGELYVVRPDRLRWELRDRGSVTTYWVLPDGLAFKSKTGSGRISKGASGPLGGVLADLLVLLGGDLATLKARYEFRLLRRDAAGVVLHALPRDATVAKTTQRIELQLSADLSKLERVSIVERGNDRSDIVFSSIKQNIPVDPALMTGP